MKAKDGRMLCNPHRTTGAPVYHYPGCEMCETARVTGIVRPDVDSVPKAQRGRRRHLERRFDWNKIPKENRSGLVDAIWAGRTGGKP
jgi:hypothetical protein